MFNQAVLVGRITKDPEVRYSGELAIARFSLAIDDGYGEKKKTNFPSVVCFGKAAEFMGKNVRKGKLLAVSGKIQTGSYEKSDGTKVYTTEVSADRVQLLEWDDKKKDSNIPDGFAEVEDSDCPF